MRKVFFTVLVVLMLAGCDPGLIPNPAPLPQADITLKRAVVGSGSYYIESTTGSRAIAGGSLKYVQSGTLGTVTFLDTDGNPASVEVSNALSLSGGGLVIEATYLGVTSAYIVNPAGGLTECVPAPDGWDYARDDGTYLYYIAGSGLYRAPLSTGVGVLMSGTDALASDGWIKPSHGGVLYVGSSSAMQTLYRLPGDGDPVTTNLQFPSVLTNLCIEGPSGIIYRIRFAGANVYVAEFAETGADGGYIGSDEILLCTLPVSSVQHNRISSPLIVSDMTIGYAGGSDHGGYLRIITTATGLSYSITTAPAGISGASFITSPYALDTANEGAAYHAYYETGPVYDPYDITRWHVWSAVLDAPVARGIGGTTGELLTDYNISALLPIGDLLFYQRDAGAGIQTMVYDGASAKLYANGAVNIQAVK